MFNEAYSTGFDAGSAPKTLLTDSNGKKYIAPAECPYKKRSQFILRLFWWNGYDAGMNKAAREWLQSRKHLYEV